MSFKETVTLNDGRQMPKLGLGTWQSEPGQVAEAIVAAVEAGYRHLDLALVYGNQPEVGQALKTVKEKLGVDRKDLWITSKLWNVSHRPEDVESDLDYTLKQLGIDYLDLYLIHWPVSFKSTHTGKETKDLKFMPLLEGKSPDEVELDLSTSLVDTWKAVIALTKDENGKAKESSKARSIGVSNFTPEHLDGIISATGVIPAVNQVEAHPLLNQAELLKYSSAKDRNIHLTAYSPLGNNSIGRPLLTEVQVIKDIAGAHSADPGQVLVAWGIQKGFSEIPKSVKVGRVKSNFQQIRLTDEQIAQIDAWAEEERKATGHSRFNVPITYKPKWDINVFNDHKEQTASGQIKIN